MFYGFFYYFFFLNLPPPPPPSILLTPLSAMPLALPKVQEFQRPEWLSYTAMANWPKVRPDNSKGADQKCERSVKICLVLDLILQKGREVAEFLFLYLPV